MKDVILKLENKEKLSYDEISLLFNGYLNGDVSDKDMTHVLKLICLNGLSDEEVFDLTDIFIKSGDSFPKNDNFIDKHSTGGVGDKTTLILLPILASLGVKVSKMSGKALGHTGGTIDKLNSIGVKTNLTSEEFYDAIEKCGMVISSQTSNLCPMDKKVYALRDVTGTTMSIPLIASSIMSKKIASGAGKILLDVKVGSGALLNNISDAEKLSDLMIKIGKKYDREVVCMLTDMDVPLGDNVGNKIEILEVIDILKNGKRNSLSTLVIEMASLMLSMYEGSDVDLNRDRVIEVLSNGKSYETFLNYVNYMGGSLDIDISNCFNLFSKSTGYISLVNSLLIGESSMKFGAGRVKKDDEIDYDAGIILVKNYGDFVYEGDVIAKISGSGNGSLYDVYKAFSFSSIEPKKRDVILKIMK